MDEYPIIDLSHLLPAVQGLARLPADERIQRLRADRWIGYPRAVEALNRLETLYAWPNKQRMPIPVVVGGENAAGGLAGLSGQAVRRLVEGGADVLLYGLGVASRMQPGKLEIE